MTGKRESGHVRVFITSNGRKLGLACPHCGEAGNADVISLHSQSNRTMAAFVVCSSPTCARPIMVVFHGGTDAFNKATPPEGTVVTGLLEPAPRPTYEAKGVPPKVAKDFTEALCCRAAGFLLGAALVGRRVLQMAVRDRGAKRGNLQDEIDSLADDVLPAQVKESAHEVRYIGNDAAHADDVDGPAVADLLEFADLVLEHLYVIPARLAESKARRDAAKAAKTT